MASLRSGMPLPDEMKNSPEILPTLELFWRCFWALRRGLDRQQTISWRSVQEWCGAYNVDPETALACQSYIVVLDDIWISLIPKKEPPPQPPTRMRR